MWGGSRQVKSVQDLLNLQSTSNIWVITLFFYFSIHNTRISFRVELQYHLGKPMFCSLNFIHTREEARLNRFNISENNQWLMTGGQYPILARKHRQKTEAQKPLEFQSTVHRLSVNILFHWNYPALASQDSQLWLPTTSPQALQPYRPLRELLCEGYTQTSFCEADSTFLKGFVIVAILCPITSTNKCTTTRSVEIFSLCQSFSNLELSVI